MGDENLTGKSGDRAVVEGMGLPFAGSDSSPAPGHLQRGFLQAGAAERKSSERDRNDLLTAWKRP